VNSSMLVTMKCRGPRRVNHLIVEDDLPDPRLREGRMDPRLVGRLDGISVRASPDAPRGPRRFDPGYFLPATSATMS
jgi:hypothetical protein